MPLIIKPKRAYKQFCAAQHTISWKAIAEHMPTRSIDDIRNYWMLKVVPILTGPKARLHNGSSADQEAQLHWTEADDIRLLEGVEAQEVSD